MLYGVESFGSTLVLLRVAPCDRQSTTGYLHRTNERQSDRSQTDHDPFGGLQTEFRARALIFGIHGHEGERGPPVRDGGGSLQVAIRSPDARSSQKQAPYQTQSVGSLHSKAACVCRHAPCVLTASLWLRRRDEPLLRKLTVVCTPQCCRGVEFTAILITLKLMKLVA